MTALPDYDSPLALKAFLDARGMAMQKKFGQNFMVNRASRERLVDALSLGTGSTVWEIGPGLGAMTDEILNRGAKLTAFEIDRGFSAVLGEIFADRANFSLIQGDVLKNWRPAVERLGVPDCLFGNLPYNIAAAIIGDMISDGIRFNTVVVTVQKEVALTTIAEIEASGSWPGPVVSEINPEEPFWEAEPEHQEYLVRYPGGYSCHFVRPTWRLDRSDERPAVILDRKS